MSDNSTSNQTINDINSVNTALEDDEVSIYSLEDQAVIDDSNKAMSRRYFDVAGYMKKHLRDNNELVSLMSTKYM